MLLSCVPFYWGGGGVQFVDMYSACTSFGSYANMPWLQSNVCLHFLMSGFLSALVVCVTFPEVDMQVPKCLGTQHIRVFMYVLEKSCMCKISPNPG